jgi:hypothetical protein
MIPVERIDAHFAIQRELPAVLVIEQIGNGKMCWG